MSIYFTLCMRIHHIICDLPCLPSQENQYFQILWIFECESVNDMFDSLMPRELQTKCLILYFNVLL